MITAKIHAAKIHALVLVLLIGAQVATGCGGSKATPGGQGGQTSTDTGGASSTGGASPSTGGAVTGGLPATGGMSATGGMLATGGVSTPGGAGGRAVGSSGGNAQSGGIVAAGGTVLAGGNARTGGAIGNGGSGATGGIVTAGGTTALAGTTAAGGSPPAGGTTATGGAGSLGWVTIHNDFFIYDTDGNLLQVRSGALDKYNGLFYWYGSPPPATDQVAYTSSDLVHWTYKGVIAKLPKDANRMDVLYNDTTKKWVMFLKYIGNAAFVGISTADAPAGPFTVPPTQTLVDGYSIGDMSAWKDDDGQAYLAYVWDKTGPNRQHGIYRMSADYLTLDKQMYLFDVPSREAPHMFKRNGTYYYGVSETNGIDPSPTRYYTATNLTGPWSGETMLVTPGSATTYETQCDFVFPFTGTDGTVYMLDADRWKPSGNFMGNYVWLPYTFSATGAPTANYYQDWDLNVAAGTWREFDRTTRDLALGKTATASSTNGANAATNVTKATTYQNYTASRWESAAADPQWIMVDLGSAVEINRVILKWYSNYGKAFKIQVSTDSTTWTDVFSTTVGASYSVTDEKFAKTTARYVRMNGTQRGNANGYSLFAFMILNDV
jgi:hypothetical protein